jgi:hypothetical protein
LRFAWRSVSSFGLGLMRGLGLAVNGALRG